MPDRHLDFTPPFIAHRGARAVAPENTMAAFEAARAAGAKWIETDVKLTADGVPVLMHDDRLDRTTNGRGAVAETNWAEIRELDAGGWFAPQFSGMRVPTLAELLAFARQSGMRLNLELKPCPGRARATAMVALIAAAQLWPEDAPPLFISSFDIEALSIAAQLHPGWPRALLLDDWRDDWRACAARVGADALNIDADRLTPERLAALREADMPVLAYTVNDAARARMLLGAGVKAVFCDDPAALIGAL